MSTTMKTASILKDGKTLLPEYISSLVSIGNEDDGRQIVVFDSHPKNENVDDENNKKMFPAIFLHGFPDNATSFRLVATKIMNETGRRCILFSCPGYDVTSAPAPRGSLDPDSVAKDFMIAIDNVLGKSSKFHLVGHDWGAVHALAMAQNKDLMNRIASLCLAAVPNKTRAGMKQYPYVQLANSWYIAFFQLPILPELWIRYGGGLEYLWKRWSPDYDLHSSTESVYFESVRRSLLSQNYVLHSAINMYRNTVGFAFLFQWLLLQLIFAIRWLLGKDNSSFQLPPQPIDDDDRKEIDAFFTMPVMGITGAKDGCIDTRLFDVGMTSTQNKDDCTYPLGCTLLRIPNAGHFVFSEAPGPIVKALVPFFDKADHRPADELKLLKADYFVVGAGAMGMAFTDTIITENPNATVILVDREEHPGGHWNYSYPFCKLHQPSSAYGVNSKRLGPTDKMDPYNLATREEVLVYYKEVLADFIKTGRVQYFPMCEADLDTSTFVVKDKTTNDNSKDIEYRVLVTKKVVDATFMKVTVPKMLPIPFPINDPTVFAAAVNELPQMAANHGGTKSEFVVVGAGKTGVDAVLELLELEVAPSHIIWINPNDSWYILREELLNPSRMVEQRLNLLEALLESNTSSESFLKLEPEQTGIGFYCRLDPAVTPTKFKAATIGVDDLPKLRTVHNVVRMGRIKSVEKGRLVLEKGEYKLSNSAVLIDCTANGLAPVKAAPIFNGKRISLQPVVQFQQVYSAAIIAHVENKIPDKDESIKNEICVVVQHNVDVKDYAKTSYLTFKALMGMMKYGLSGFAFKSRLNFDSSIPLWRLLWATYVSDLPGKVKKYVEKVESGGMSDIPIPVELPGQEVAK